MTCFTYKLKCTYHGNIRCLAIISLLLLAMFAALAKGKSSSFTGEIMDKMCAQMNSHEDMMKSEGATNAKDCTLKCVKDGGSYALYDSASKKVYPLEDTKQVRQYAGERVQITGTYDSDADLLHVKSITPSR
jgi:hypothetical protein